jgi:oxygen-independent coproporphyrinogen-3 oxidase
MPDWTDHKNKIISEIALWRKQIGRAKIPTIFFGGGTPSLMPINIFAEIIDVLRNSFSVYANAEITIEANPGTLDKTKLKEFIAAGVNRISIGVQSLRDDELKFLGRIHDASTARELIAIAQNSGLRVSADFIYGLPNHTPTDIKELCKNINSLGLEHASLYELSIEPGTPFAQQNLQMPDNETMAQMYEVISETLSLPRYEVSNYGTPCKHNSNIWDGQPYLGFGDGAAGRVLIDNKWYETANGMQNPLSDNQRAIEILMTGLRTTRGVLMTPEIMEIIDLNFANGDNFIIKNNRLIAKSFLTLDNLIVKLLK